MTLNDNVNPWNDINVIHPRTLWHEDQSKEVECYVAAIKHSCKQKLCLWD